MGNFVSITNQPSILEMKIISAEPIYANIYAKPGGSIIYIIKYTICIYLVWKTTILNVKNKEAVNSR